MSQALTSPDLVAYVDGWNAARESREQQRRDPYGYLSYAGFHTLGTSPARFAGIPGRWSIRADGPVVELADGEELIVAGELVTGSHGFGPVREREFRRAAQHGDVILELSTRGGQSLLRPIDPAFGRGLRGGYDHTPAYEPDPRWIVEGQFRPFESLRPTPFDATVGDIVHTHLVVGEVVFTIAGTEQRLLVMVRDDQQAGVAGTGTVLFTDGTSGLTTDRHGRSLQLDFPAQAGAVTLDFNFARNLQRPYTSFAPCPLPPAQNTVTAAVEAGEQLPVFNGG
ncbi:DUF1684 domain-containing protein [Jatrophihabitans sp.]|uniref:DUF1684 domain-containing protein n=1 Tax=Jatrophihabitans sp. TaxID=1932789 RepID=UPI0030C7578C